MKKVLITGSNGLLGQKLVNILSKKEDIELIATSHSSNKIIGIDNFTFDNLDITNKTEVNYIIDKHLPDTIINAAAMTQVDLCDEKRAECWDVNVNAVAHLAEKAKQSNAFFLHLSSDFVFDGTTGMYKEEDIPNPVSYYGLSKYESEKIVLAATKNCAVVRTILVYGVLKSMTRSNIVLWVKNNLEAGKAIRVVNDQFRMPTLAEDLALGCIAITEKKKTGIFHISGNEMMNIYEIAIKTAESFDLNKNLIIPVASIELDEKAKRPPKTGFDLYKAYTELSYMPTKFTDGLKLLKTQLGGLG